MPINKKSFAILLAATALIIGVVYSILPTALRYYILNKNGERYIAITRQSNFDVMNVQAGRWREILDGNILPAGLTHLEKIAYLLGYPHIGS